MQFIIYSGAAAHAKSDLRREIEKQTIRPAIAEYILSKMNINDVDTPDNMTEPTEEDYMSGGTEEISRPVEYINRPPSPSDSEIGVIHVNKKYCV